MLLVMLKNVLCIVADGLSKNVDFFIVRKKHFHHEEKVFSRRCLKRIPSFLLCCPFIIHFYF